MQIEWTPLTKSGANLCTKRLVSLGATKIAFVPSFGYLFLCAMFLVPAAFILRKLAHISTPAAWYLQNPLQAVQTDIYTFQVLHSDAWLAIPFISIFLIAGLVALYFALRPIFFNLHNRLFIKGYPLLNRTTLPLHQIHALQMIDSSSNTSDTTNYELNLMLITRKRINLVCHSEHKIIRKQANRLAQTLAIPFWDLTRR